MIKEIALLGLKLGFTAFGGPAAHIAMLHDEAVQRRQWLTELLWWRGAADAGAKWAAAVLLFRFQVNTTWLIAGGALSGWISSAMG